MIRKETPRTKWMPPSVTIYDLITRLEKLTPLDKLPLKQAMIDLAIIVRDQMERSEPEDANPDDLMCPEIDPGSGGRQCILEYGHTGIHVHQIQWAKDESRSCLDLGRRQEQLKAHVDAYNKRLADALGCAGGSGEWLICEVAKQRDALEEYRESFLRLEKERDTLIESIKKIQRTCDGLADRVVELRSQSIKLSTAKNAVKNLEAAWMKLDLLRDSHTAISDADINWLNTRTLIGDACEWLIDAIKQVEIGKLVGE